MSNGQVNKCGLLMLLIKTEHIFCIFQRKIKKIFLENNKSFTSEKIRKTPYSVNQKLLEFNAVQFKQSLSNVSQRSSGQSGTIIQFPNSNGELEKFQVWESSNFDPALQAQFPDIRAYVGKGITDPSAVLNFSFSPRGIQTMVFRADKGTEFIEPYTKDNSVYVIFDSATRIAGELPFNCSTEDIAISQNMRLAAVFRYAKDIPETYKGIPVIGGDNSDVRHVEPLGHIVALYAKGKAVKDTTGFVI
jgi:hypothetical protein